MFSEFSGLSGIDGLRSHQADARKYGVTSPSFASPPFGMRSRRTTSLVRSFLLQLLPPFLLVIYSRKLSYERAPPLFQPFSRKTTCPSFRLFSSGRFRSLKTCQSYAMGVRSPNFGPPREWSYDIRLLQKSFANYSPTSIPTLLLRPKISHMANPFVFLFCRFFIDSTYQLIWFRSPWPWRSKSLECIHCSFVGRTRSLMS